LGGAFVVEAVEKEQEKEKAQSNLKHLNPVKEGKSR
jgi:hypothetical protein